MNFKAAEKKLVEIPLGGEQDETPSTTAQDGQRAAAGICPTSAEKRQEGGLN